MASDKATDDEAVVVFRDEFLADEILARLPVRCVFRCTVLSKRFRQLLYSEHFWFRHGRFGARLELPYAARLQHHHGRKALYSQFHVAGPTFVMEHAVEVENRGWQASTCNGLVLVSATSWTPSSLDAVVFNPATKKEARLSLPLPHPPSKHMVRSILEFGYGPSSKVYKALIREADGDSVRLMVVSLDGSGGQEPRTVFSSDDDMECDHSLHTANGIVYLLIYAVKFLEDWDTSVLAFDVDSEAVTRIATPEGHNIATTMLEVRGRLCIYAQEDQDTVLWLLTADHQWEQLCILVKGSHRLGDVSNGLWDCGGGHVFAVFVHSGAYMYNLHEAVREEKDGSGSRLTAKSSLKIPYKWPTYNRPVNIWDYRPTLISPSSIFGAAALSGRDCESVARKHELDGTFLEITQKSVVDPMMHMLSILRPPSD